MFEEKVIKVSTQEGLEAIDKKFEDVVEIRGGLKNEPIIIIGNKKYRIRVMGDSYVHVYGRNVAGAYDNSCISVFDDSAIYAYGKSRIESFDNSAIQSFNNSLVIAYGTTIVDSANNSFVVAYQNAIVRAYDNSKVEAYDNSFVIVRGEGIIHLYDYAKGRFLNENINYICNDNAKVFLPTKSLDEYIKKFNIEDKGDTLIMYKAVHKGANGSLYSDWDKDFKYLIGGLVTEPNTCPVLDCECGGGIHVASLRWALKFGAQLAFDDDLAIIELEVPKDAIVVYPYTDGKIRASRAKVLREIDLNECGAVGRMLKSRILKR